MTRAVRWNWHRLCGWLHLILAGHRFGQGDWHVGRADRHHRAADRILWPPPPRGPPDPGTSAVGDDAPAQHDRPQIR